MNKILINNNIGYANPKNAGILVNAGLTKDAEYEVSSKIAATILIKKKIR